MSRGTSALADRIGPVHAVEDLCTHLTDRNGSPLTSEAVHERARQNTLVAFLTDDGQWAFPAWQFDHLEGRLVPNHNVIELWSRLPHRGFLSDADLAAWMNTRFGTLPEQTPVQTVREHGSRHPALDDAVRRLHQRADEVRGRPRRAAGS